MALVRTVCLSGEDRLLGACLLSVYHSHKVHDVQVVNCDCIFVILKVNECQKRTVLHVFNAHMKSDELLTAFAVEHCYLCWI